jgi:DNA polymerase
MLLIDKQKELNKISENIKICTKCSIGTAKPFGLDPHVTFEGNINSRFLFVGFNPGYNEIKQKRPFVGASGQELRETILNYLKIKENDYFICNSVNCFTPQNRVPSTFEINNCFSYLEKIIEIVNPVCIILLGTVPVKAVLKKNDFIAKLICQKFKYKHYDTYVLPHPASKFRNTYNEKMWYKALEYLKSEVKNFNDYA